jgi:hypothetical protein
MSSKSDGSTYNTDISADPSQFEAAMSKAVSAALGASGQIDAQFKKVGDTFSAVSSKLMAFTAVLAGGGALKKFINDANAWNGEAAKMAKQLGVTTERASVLNVALTRLGIGSDVYTAAADKLSKQITNNGQAFEAMGVKTKDASGSYRNVTEVMQEVNDKIGAITDTVHRDEAGRQAYGKSWTEVRAILKVNNEVMQQAEKRARELGLIVGPEGAEMTKQYKKQMADLNLVGQSLQVQFGNALLPVFAKTGQWLSKEGPQAGKVFATVLEGVVFVAQSVWLALTDMGDGIGALAAQAAALLSGDLEGAKAIGRARDAEAARNAQKYEEMKKAFGQPLPAVKVEVDEQAKKKNGPRYNFGKDTSEEGTTEKTPTRMPKFEEELARLKVVRAEEGLVEDQYREYSKSEEAKFWAGKAKLAGLSVGDRLAATKKSEEANLAVMKDTLDRRVQMLETESAQYKTNTEEKIRIERQVQSMYQQGSQGYEASAKKIAELQRQANEQEDQAAAVKLQMKRDAAIQAIAIEEQGSQQALELGVISQAKMLEFQAQFEQRRYEISHEALLDRLADALVANDQDRVEKERINNELEQLEQQHQLKMGQIRGATQASGLQPLSNMFKGTEDAIGTSISGILNRTVTMRQAMANVYKSMTATITGEIGKWIAAKVAMFAKEKLLALAGIGADAAKAGSGAAASQASIPIAGPFLAAAALAATFAAVMAMGSRVPSAAGGFDIPKGVNPLTQLHEREMVLPARHADVIRAMADGGGGAGGGGENHFHFNGYNSRELEHLMTQRGGADVLVKVLTERRRNGGFM